MARHLGSLVLSLAFFAASVAAACTTFLIPGAPEAVMGKSYDWHHSHGLLMVNKRNVAKKGLPLKFTDRPPTWTAKYGSLTFNQIAREFPNSGVNEEGLAVEIMVGGNKDPEQGKRPTLNELQWIQYQLDNYATVKDVIEHAEDIHVSRVHIMVHYLVCDKSRACGVIEFIDGKLVTRSGDKLVVPTLANSHYDDSIDFLKEHKGFGGDKELPQSTLSLHRFVRATALAKDYDPAADVDATDHAFKVLDSVFAPKDSEGQHTSQWSIVYGLRDGKVAWRTFLNKDRRSVDAKAFDYSCKKPVLVLDVQKGKGDLTKEFVEFTDKANVDIINASLSDLIKEGKLPGIVTKLLSGYPGSTKCMED